MPTDETAAFGRFIQAIQAGSGRGGNLWPSSDADDFDRGATWIPDDVTVARRGGQRVEFVQEQATPQCTRSCWYWRMPDGERIYHDRMCTHSEANSSEAESAD